MSIWVFSNSNGFSIKLLHDKIKSSILPIHFLQPLTIQLYFEAERKAIG